MDSPPAANPFTIAPLPAADLVRGAAAVDEIQFIEAPFLIFRGGASLFGVPSTAVRGIHALPLLSPLPETAPFIIGVFNRRGAIVPVMDLAARLGKRAPPHHAAPYRLDDALIVLSANGADVAILVNEVRAVAHLRRAQIALASTPSPGDEKSPFVAFVAQIGADIVPLLDLPALLQPSHLNFQSETAARPENGEGEARRFQEQEWSPDERAILEARAARLRTSGEEESGTSLSAPVAVVALGGEEFGIALEVVREFVAVSSVAAVPCCPPHILGQINLRGDIVTLVDIRATLHTARRAPKYFEAARDRTATPVPQPVVVVQHEGTSVGIVIDEVRDVLYLHAHERQLDAAACGGQEGKYFSGGTRHDGRLLPLLDLTKLWEEGDLEVADER